MLGRTNTGGGGGGLNFQVIGSTKRPDRPTENMVWVNTNVDITDYVLSATEPESPAQGMVWIKISDSSDIKIGTPIDKDYITIMLDSGSQYVGGTWVGREAMAFQGGVWSTMYFWDGTLYDAGNEYEETTGGYGAYAVRYNSNLTSSTIAPTITKQSDGSMKITYGTSGGYGGGIVRTINKIDLSRYSSLEFTGYLYTTGSGEYVTVRIWNEIGEYHASNCFGTITGSNNKTIKTYEPLDVSTLEGEYYIGFGIYMNTAGAEIVCQKLKLNK